MLRSAGKTSAVVIGGGPSGLMAAETLAQAGIQVDVFDAMPSVGRKFLLAGIGGLNMTHSEPHEVFCSRFGDRQPALKPLLDLFSPDQYRHWAHELGIETFVGSSGRVFPKEMKAAPLLRAWLQRMRGLGVRFSVRHRWLGWVVPSAADSSIRLSGPQGEIELKPDILVLALGGASWPKLGSNGAWVPLLTQRGIGVTPLESANCGFEVHWSGYLTDRYAGSPVKNVGLQFVDSKGHQQGRVGELLLSREGLEGGLLYAYSAPIRESIKQNGECRVFLDLLPGKSLERVRKDLGQQRGGHPLATFLKARLGLSGVKVALIHEVLNKEQIDDLNQIAQTVKALPVVLKSPRPLAEAISTAGGVQFECLTEQLMIKTMPGVFVTGEMLDWEAPTGGYLLTACMATGLAAGKGAVEWLKAKG